VTLVLLALVFLVVGVLRLLHPDPTPEPVLPPDPAQQIVFLLMIGFGAVVLFLTARGVVADWRLMRRVRRRRQPPD
jgi:hypothetical protein